jgi:hypothetical protein
MDTGISSGCSTRYLFSTLAAPNFHLRANLKAGCNQGLSAFLMKSCSGTPSRKVFGGWAHCRGLGETSLPVAFAGKPRFPGVNGAVRCRGCVDTGMGGRDGFQDLPSPTQARGCLLRTIAIPVPLLVRQVENAGFFQLMVWLAYLPLPGRAWRL